MPFGTAQNRLRQDLFWMLLVETGRTNCCICGEDMDRNTFSIEHSIPWQNSENPKELFFDTTNIDFAHKSCNFAKGARKSAICGTISSYKKGCRCSECSYAESEYKRKRYSKENRQAQYLRTGK